MKALKKNNAASTAKPHAQNKTMPAIISSKGERMVWGLDLHSWENLMRGSLLAVGVFGLIGGLATWFVVSLQRDEIAASEQKLESVKAANLALEKQIAPRSFSVEQQSEVIANFSSSLKGKKIAVWSYILDPDGAQLAGQILFALDRANVSFVDKRAAFAPLGGFVTGIHVISADKQLASAIRGALAVNKSLQIADEGETAKLMTDSSDDATIWVALKPLPQVKK